MTIPGPVPDEVPLLQLQQYREALAGERDTVAEELKTSPLMVRFNDLTERIRRADAAIIELTRPAGQATGTYPRRLGTLGWAREYVQQAPADQDITSAGLAPFFLARGWVKRSDVTVRQSAAKALGTLCRDEGLLVRRKFGVYRKASPPPPVS